MIRSFPKLGCGVPGGMGAGAVVVGAKAILGGEENRRIGGGLGMESSRCCCIFYTPTSPISRLVVTRGARRKGEE